jgi:predicted Zn-dependent protease
MIKRIFLVLVIAFASAASAQTSDPSTRELLSIINERTKASDQRFADQEKAVAAALAAAKEAVTKAEYAAEKRFDLENGVRGQLKDQQSTLMPRSETLALLKSMDEKVQNNNDRINQVINESKGANWLWGVISATGGLLAGVFLAAIALYRKTSTK